MVNTSPKFGGWGLCATCGRESEVKATENKKWMVTEKRKIRPKEGLEKRKKNQSRWSTGGSTVLPFPVESEGCPLDHRYLRKGFI